ncbi:MAG: DUF1080 domain-containing protein [Acidobacteria bacterium]|nr:DUF1080 domain-containing protein [Acidobacteriota bacterium]
MRLIWSVCFGLVLLGVVSAHGQSDWVDLFNGRDLSGWHVLNGQAEYRVDNGVIVGVTKMDTPNSFLATNKDYGDFILEVDVKMDPTLNSGIQIRSLSLEDYQNGRVHGYQVEIDPSARAWSGGLYDEARRGWLYNLECNPEGKKAYKRDDWNRYHIEAIGPNIRVWLNGIPTADVIDDMTAGGFIALQVHSINDPAMAGKTVQFRRVRIMTDNLDVVKTSVSNAIPQISYLTNQLTEREKREGWSLLWDGKTAQGWRGAKLDHFPDKGWTINNGILTVEESTGGESTNGGDIVTTKMYGNFELEADFKFTHGANSGIKYFVDTELNQGEGSAIGCEFQILDDRNHPDAKAGTAGNRTLGSLYDLIPADNSFYAPHESTTKRVNMYGWNRAKVVVQGNHVEHYLNGTQVVEYERRTQMWRALVARSKYVVWPNFGEAERGHILLQDHGDEVSFKNIKIKKLD